MVGDEIDDVEEPLESVVLAVIFFCMEKVFGDPCRVLSKTEIEEGESEVEQHGEGKVDDDAVCVEGRRERDLRVLDRGRRDGDVGACG